MATRHSGDADATVQSPSTVSHELLNGKRKSSSLAGTAPTAASRVMQQGRVGLAGPKRSVIRDLLCIHDEHLGRGADFPGLREIRVSRYANYCHVRRLAPADS